MGDVYIFNPLRELELLTQLGEVSHTASREKRILAELQIDDHFKQITPSTLYHWKQFLDQAIAPRTPLAMSLQMQGARIHGAEYYYDREALIGALADKLARDVIDVAWIEAHIEQLLALKILPEEWRFNEPDAKLGSLPPPGKALAHQDQSSRARFFSLISVMSNLGQIIPFLTHWISQRLPSYPLLPAKSVDRGVTNRVLTQLSTKTSAELMAQLPVKKRRPLKALLADEKGLYYHYLLEQLTKRYSHKNEFDSVLEQLLPLRDIRLADSLAEHGNKIKSAHFDALLLLLANPAQLFPAPSNAGGGMLLASLLARSNPQLLLSIYQQWLMTHGIKLEIRGTIFCSDEARFLEIWRHHDASEWMGNFVQHLQALYRQVSEEVSQAHRDGSAFWLALNLITASDQTFAHYLIGQTNLPNQPVVSNPCKIFLEQYHSEIYALLNFPLPVEVQHPLLKQATKKILITDIRITAESPADTRVFFYDPQPQNLSKWKTLGLASLEFGASPGEFSLPLKPFAELIRGFPMPPLQKRN